MVTLFIFQWRATFKTSNIIFCFSIRPSQLERVETQKKSVAICVMTSCKLTDLEIFRCIKSLMDCPLPNFGWTPFPQKEFHQLWQIWAESWQLLSVSKGVTSTSHIHYRRRNFSKWWFLYTSCLMDAVTIFLKALLMGWR